MIELDNKTNSRAVDALLNFETVKYYNAEKWEVEQYTDSIKNSQKADFKSNTSLQFLNSSQNLIISTGLLAGCLLCAQNVINEKMTIGDFSKVLAIAILCFSPPLNLNPRSPTIVSYPSGNSIILS